MLVFIPMMTGLYDLFLDSWEDTFESIDSVLLRLMRRVKVQFLGGGCLR
jgi:hypothetical protein